MAKILLVTTGQYALRRESKMDSHRFDVVVVGAGTSGLIAAGVAAHTNQKVALVATGPGGFVLGSGCLQAKEFIHARTSPSMGAHRFKQARKSA